MELLPNLGQAIIPLEKLRDYALNMEHPEGRHKATVFKEVLESSAGMLKYWPNSSGQRCPRRRVSVERATNMGTIGPPTMESSGSTLKQLLLRSRGYSKNSRAKHPNWYHVI